MVVPDTAMVRKRMPKHPLTIAKNAIIFQRKGAMPIVRNSFIQMSKLPNVKGRISYISSKASQEAYHCSAGEFRGL